jgi:tRNA 2-thiouridine synthesizing protein E
LSWFVPLTKLKLGCNPCLYLTKLLIKEIAMSDTINVDGKEFAVDEEGYLANINDWVPGVADVMSKQDELELTDEHWDIIKFLREYYEEYQIAPAIRVLTKAVAKNLGKDKGNSKYLYGLFPYGPGKQACRYAGLPKPTGCV